MTPIWERFESFPVRLAVLTTAVAATSAFVFPGVFIPDNLSILGPTGSLLTVIVFLVSWALEKELLKWRKPVFLVLGILGMASLVMLIVLNTSYVVQVRMGDPPEERRFLIGTALTPWGDSMRVATASPDEVTLVERIGEAAIPRAWGSSLRYHQSKYIVVYLTLGISIIVMIAVAMARDTPRPVAPAPVTPNSPASG